VTAECKEVQNRTSKNSVPERKEDLVFKGTGYLNVSDVTV
jgi:hypothetical protein